MERTLMVVLTVAMILTVSALNAQEYDPKFDAEHYGVNLVFTAPCNMELEDSASVILARKLRIYFPKQGENTEKVFVRIGHYTKPWVDESGICIPSEVSVDKAQKFITGSIHRAIFLKHENEVFRVLAEKEIKKHVSKEYWVEKNFSEPWKNIYAFMVQLNGHPETIRMMQSYYKNKKNKTWSLSSYGEEKKALYLSEDQQWLNISASFEKINKELLEAL